MDVEAFSPVVELPLPVLPRSCLVSVHREKTLGTVISDLIFAREEASPHFSTHGSASLRAQGWWEPCGLPLPEDSEPTGLAAGRLLSIGQGSVGRRDDAPNGSGADSGASHHPACPSWPPFQSPIGDSGKASSRG